MGSTPGPGLSYDKTKLSKDPNSANFRKLSDAMARVEKEAKRNEEEKREREEAERKAKEARERRVATLNNLLVTPDKEVGGAVEVDLSRFAINQSISHIILPN